MLVRLINRLGKVAVVIVSALLLLHLSGVNLTAVLTGLGLGGIAIAFAAQKTLENLFGGIMVISDKPIQVGDFCRAGEFTGVVEDIGLRSTRLRTLERTMVSIPNGQLATMSLENFTLRDRIRFLHVVGLRYETTADQLRYVLAEIRRLLYEHSKVDSTDARVRFVRFGSSSLDLEVLAYVLVTDYPAFLGIQEDLLLRIMDIIEASGTSVAFPSQTTYFVEDRGLNHARGQEASTKVQTWREHSDLPFPDFPVEKIAEFDGAIEYPPAGSAVKSKNAKVLGAAVNSQTLGQSSWLPVADGSEFQSLFAAPRAELLLTRDIKRARPPSVLQQPYLPLLACVRARRGAWADLRLPG
jgi:MscS family membrane protein